MSSFANQNDMDDLKFTVENACVKKDPFEELKGNVNQCFMEFNKYMKAKTINDEFKYLREDINLKLDKLLTKASYEEGLDKLEDKHRKVLRKIDSLLN